MSTSVTENVYLPSNPQYKMHQIQKHKCFSSRLAVVFAQSIDGNCEVENEDVVWGNAPVTSWVIKNFIAYYGVAYIRGFTVYLIYWEGSFDIPADVCPVKAVTLVVMRGGIIPLLPVSRSRLSVAVPSRRPVWLSLTQCFSSLMTLGTRRGLTVKQSGRLLLLFSNPPRRRRNPSSPWIRRQPMRWMTPGTTQMAPLGRTTLHHLKLLWSLRNHSSTWNVVC